MEFLNTKVLELPGRGIINPIQPFLGSVVEVPGDNLPAAFGSLVADATECAVKIQQALEAKNLEWSYINKLPPEIRFDSND